MKQQSCITLLGGREEVVDATEEVEKREEDDAASSWAGEGEEGSEFALPSLARSSLGVSICAE